MMNFIVILSGIFDCSVFTITIDNVNLLELEDSKDDIQEALLMVDIDPWLQYKVIYNPNAKNKKDQQEIISYTIYT